MSYYSRWMSNVRQRMAHHLEHGTSSLESSSTILTKKNVNAVQQQEQQKVTTREVAATQVYLDPSRTNVAKQAPYALIPSNLLHPGHAFAGTHPDGRPVVVYRDYSNTSTTTTNVSAFVNQCRHRGAPVFRMKKIENNNNNGTAIRLSSSSPARFICPYHAWTYHATTGALQGVPSAAQAFPCLNKQDFGLKPVQCMEKAGFVWVGGGEHFPNNQWYVEVEEVHHDLAPLLQSTTTTTTAATSNTDKNMTPLVGYREWNVQANWQLAVETFLESYHVKSLHNKTLNKVTHSDNVMITDVLQGRNFRMTTPLKNFDTKYYNDNNDNDDEQSILDFLGQTTTTTLLFPCTSVSLFKRFALYMSINPVGIDECQIRTWGTDHAYYNSSLSSKDYDRELQIRDFESVIQAVEEDWDIIEHIQKGLSSSTTTTTYQQQPVTFAYGKNEGCNVAFLENVEKVAKEMNASLHHPSF